MPFLVPEGNSHGFTTTETREAGLSLELSGRTAGRGHAGTVPAHRAQPTTHSSSASPAHHTQLCRAAWSGREALLPCGLPRDPEPSPASPVLTAGSNPSWLLSLLWGQRGCSGGCCHPEPQCLWSEHPRGLSSPACLAGDEPCAPQPGQRGDPTPHCGNGVLLGLRAGPTARGPRGGRMVQERRAGGRTERLR